MANYAWHAQSCKTIAISHMGVTRVTMQSYSMGSLRLMWILLCTLLAAIGLFFSSIAMNSTYAQIEVTTDKNISSPIFNRTEAKMLSQDLIYCILRYVPTRLWAKCLTTLRILLNWST
jgi:hypothetical protein